MVLRAVHRGRTSVQAIASYTGLTVDRVKSVIDELRGKKYKADVPLLEGEDGGFQTRF